MIKSFFLLIFVLITFNAFTQIGFGTVGGFDFYQRYQNPKDNIAYPASGNAILNIIYGPKIWFGGKSFSVSFEGHVNLGLTAFALKDFKGFGAISFPLIGKLNFNGLSGFHTGFAKGFSLGSGIQYSKTELYYLNNDYKDKGVKRPFYDVIFGQIDIGVGSFGTDASIYVRYGFNMEKKSKVLNVGMVFNSNKTFKKKMRKLSAPVENPLNLQ